MRRLFRALLCLYPRRHRELFGAEMQAVFDEGAQQRQLLGAGPYLRFVLRELGSLVVGVIAAQCTRAVRSDYRETQTAAHSPQQHLPVEVVEAQNRVSVNLNHLLFAISHHQFREARFYSNEERKAREDLRRVRAKYGLGDSV